MRRMDAINGCISRICAQTTAPAKDVGESTQLINMSSVAKKINAIAFVFAQNANTI